MSTPIRVAPCLGASAAATLRQAAEAFGPYHTYVSAPLGAGLGKGLVRRHDAVMHHYQSRLRAGIAEPLDVFAARTNLLRGTYGERGALGVADAGGLWHHPGYLDAARRVSGRALVVPTMLYANIMLPGQELPVHTDTPVYRGLDQTNAPEWLLVAMHHAGLFERWRVPVVGAVAFFGGCSGGDFIVYDDGAPTRVAAADDTAIVFDADGTFHGVARVGAPDAPAPRLDVGAAVRHVAGDRWQLDGGDPLRWGDFRFSVQWKARCFADEADRLRAEQHSEDLTQAEAVATLVDDLRARGVVGDAPPDDTQLALRMIETYIPFPDAPLPA